MSRENCTFLSAGPTEATPGFLLLNPCDWHLDFSTQLPSCGEWSARWSFLPSLVTLGKVPDLSDSQFFSSAATSAQQNISPEVVSVGRVK